MDSIGAKHVGDLVRIRDDRRGSVRQHCSRELIDGELGGLDVHVRVDEARYQIRAGHIHSLPTVVPAEADDMAVRDGDVHLEPLLGEDGQHLAAGHD